MRAFYECNASGSPGSNRKNERPPRITAAQSNAILWIWMEKVSGESRAQTRVPDKEKELAAELHTTLTAIGDGSCSRLFRTSGV